jgi:hypothetical protein
MSTTSPTPRPRTSAINASKVTATTSCGCTYDDLDQQEGKCICNEVNYFGGRASPASLSTSRGQRRSTSGPATQSGICAINCTAFAAEWIARQITETFPWDQAPRYLIRDRDDSYGAIVRNGIRVIGIRDRPTAPRSPWQNGHIERLIGSIRRECLDHVVVLGDAHVRRILKGYADYYNRVRTHLALDKDATFHRLVQATGSVVAIPLLAGLHHQYARIT